ncbi:MAG TPA: pyruvate synthase [Candidatus Moranbacteria bacterium]|nr:MAG: Pyruvate synthase subunit PorC [Parcubacteria group bacterium GW2011_GWC1_36_108]KKQ00855.1 MAG: Pyruvate synthase subunit PorC [Candidatus Moranbacteria bacterium GW2011_GWD1_36_198]KKQ02288.1 MAG: Pyruvate synthase subunit PorC [Candidatus Moranbacteria bacterium GW2011_GWD2_36_198]KKQ39984.1 MAG: Pyruvate synthase subunit PorC [Candidatus Moranbacteria bacterium GW2011_GWC2_37_73]MDD5464124.1 2-oxoacid:acceptor oxidoreductase family protein [Candidatus Moranbacteria bacterium]
MKLNKDTFEIIFFARGGQGAKTASELIAHSAVREGKFVKAFPFFGPERSGAPTKMFLRVSDKEIRTQEPVTDPDIVLVLDETVMDSQDVARNLDKHEILIVNSANSKEDVRKRVPHFKGSIHCIDGNKISADIIGKPNPNMVLMGHLIKVTEIVDLETAGEIFREVFTEKIGKDLTEKNIRAMQAGYDEL